MERKTTKTSKVTERIELVSNGLCSLCWSFALGVARRSSTTVFLYHQ